MASISRTGDGLACEVLTCTSRTLQEQQPGQLGSLDVSSCADWASMLLVQRVPGALAARCPDLPDHADSLGNRPNGPRCLKPRLITAALLGGSQGAQIGAPAGRGPYAPKRVYSWSVQLA